jgi:hypothetical protein
LEVSVEDDAGAPNEKTGFEDASVESAVEGLSVVLSADGVGVEVDGSALNEKAGFADASDAVVEESEACLLAAPKMLIPGVVASARFTPDAPKEKADLAVSTDPVACPLGSGGLPKADVAELPNTEGLLTPPNGDGFESFEVCRSVFSSLFDVGTAPNRPGGCSVAFSLSSLEGGGPNKEPEGTLGGVNCTLVFAKKEGIGPSPAAGVGVVDKGKVPDTDVGAANGLEMASAGLGADGTLDTPRLKGNFTGAVLSDDDANSS